MRWCRGWRQDKDVRVQGNKLTTIGVVDEKEGIRNKYVRDHDVLRDTIIRVCHTFRPRSCIINNQHTGLLHEAPLRSRSVQVEYKVTGEERVQRDKHGKAERSGALDSCRESLYARAHNKNNSSNDRLSLMHKN
jgi:hypothetical protein